jgi:serine protease Do
MLSRSSALVLSLTSLSAGVVLGIYLERGGPVAQAQVAAPAQADSAANHGSPPADKTLATRQKRADDAIYDQLAHQYEQFQIVNRTFELVARSVGPTVVHIVAHKKLQESRNIRGAKKDFDRQVEETGSGVIIRSERNGGLYVLTNHHVIDGAKPADIRIFLQDGRSILPLKFWNDAKADIAVLQLDRDDLPAARLGNSDDSAVGSWVMALGSPFGLTHSVSQGIISARGRAMGDDLPDVENQDFLQTDAAINPGNSGGPLVNMKGEVIGINNSIASNGGGNEGVGFSIPINLARWIMNELISHGHVTRGALGITLDSNFGQQVAASLGMERPRGALIGEVHPTSPAFQAGLHGGDVVLRFGGIEITNLYHLINTVSMAPVGKPAEVIVWRDRRELKVVVKVGERDRTFGGSSNPSPEVPSREPSGLVRRPNRPTEGSAYAMGLELITLDAKLALEHQLPEVAQGALVLNIEEDSPFKGHIQTGDAIARINEHLIKSADQAAGILNRRADHAQATIDLIRSGEGEVQRYKVTIP